jgi:hypothetical protein
MGAQARDPFATMLPHRSAVGFVWPHSRPVPKRESRRPRKPSLIRQESIPFTTDAVAQSHFFPINIARTHRPKAACLIRAVKRVTRLKRGGLLFALWCRRSRQRRSMVCGVRAISTPILPAIEARNALKSAVRAASTTLDVNRCQTARLRDRQLPIVGRHEHRAQGQVCCRDVQQIQAASEVLGGVKT